ncbi:TPA: hypothetical protein ROX88_001132 [Bacillus pseudomycoides]|nr:hypothetical protein [Bacillus pseudomycoides]
MKPITHIRSKRGFYIGRLNQEVGKRRNHPKLSSEFTGRVGMGVRWSLHQLITLDERQRTMIFDPKTSFHQVKHKLQQK